MASSQVFYRKWRPQAFSEVAGQEPITQTLRNAIGSGRIAHAYLFCGPRGTGKTSTGRILAKAVNCLQPTHGEPCNTCDMCKAFNGGQLLDIIEIDAASNRGIDDIRELRQKVNYAPGQAKYKVYIIDEVHMLTEQASNALLKTLEEPPAHSIFVLATTEPHEVLPTILSRCQRYDFRRISQAAVTKRLALIAEKEGIAVPAEGLRMVARAATGSLRDAANLLEQLVAYYGKTVELEQVREMLGVTGDARVKALAGSILARDTTGGLQTVTSVNRDGLDLRQFNRELVQYFRELLLVKSGSEEAVDVTAEDMADLKKLVATVAMEQLLKTIRIFNEADFRLDSYSSLPLELAVVESTLGDEKAPARIIRTAESARPVEPQVKAGKAEPVKAPAAVKTKEEARPVPPIPQPEPAASKPAALKAPESKTKAGPEDAVKPSETAKPAESARPASDSMASNLDYLKNHWKDFVESLRGVGSSGNIDAFLRNACEPVEIQGDTVTLAFFYPFHKDKIDDPKYRFLVEKRLTETFNKPYHVRCILRERGKGEPTNGGDDNYMARAAMKLGARVVNKRPISED
jgi:DNA polymerase-3 subunit gamma/tau